MSRIPEYRVVSLREMPPLYRIEDEFGAAPDGIAGLAFGSYHEALLEAARITRKAIDEYDGSFDGEAWSGGFAPNH